MLIKRVFDLLICLIFIVPVTTLTLVLVLLIRLTSRGPGIHWSNRVGKNNRIFKMAKLRTMYTHTPDVATHLLKDSKSFITPLGAFLRKTSLDELPQIYNVLRGDMSFVGPRPALFNQYDLIEMRTQKGIEKLLPGLTGWAQINGRDELSLEEKVAQDEYYKLNRSILLDLKILIDTFFKVLGSKNINH